MPAHVERRRFESGVRVVRHEERIGEENSLLRANHFRSCYAQIKGWLVGRDKVVAK